MEEITEFEKKRAVNIIWNSARSYSFEPDFKAFDRNGRAELYWNCIIGATRRHYDYPVLEELLLSVQNFEDCDTYEGLIWLGLENAVCRKEFPERPVLEKLRRAYAESFLRENSRAEEDHLFDALAYAHWQRVLGRNDTLSNVSSVILDSFEFSPDLSAEEISERVQGLLLRYFHTDLTKQPKTSGRGLAKPRLFHSRKTEKKRCRRFMNGFVDHPYNIYGGESADPANRLDRPATKLSEEELREFIRFKYGKPLYNEVRLAELEREICSGNHAGCHLHFTRGEEYSGSINNAFEALQKQKEQAQMQRNRDYYRANLPANRTAIASLTASIRNSALLYLQAENAKSKAGRLNSDLAWRGPVLGDRTVFIRREQDAMGDVSVDILLDASTSQKSRQELLSSQAFIIAQSLTNCSIPCRVVSFCSMTGYTILHTFRSYQDLSGNDSVFDFVSNGCNRDGLGIRALSTLMKEEPYEHRLLIVLSDAKPNDVIRMRAPDGTFIDYVAEAGINDTATEVRRARAEGISVICVFTGADEDVVSARLIYGKDFARITDIDQLADTAGKLILNAIRNL